MMPKSSEIEGVTKAARVKLEAIADGQWHPIPALVKAAELGTASSGAFGKAYSGLQRRGLAEVRYDETGYWSVAEYRITDAGRAALSARPRP